MTYVKLNGGTLAFEDEIKDDMNTVNKWFDEYLKPYLITTKVCYNEEGCWTTDDVKYLNGAVNPNHRKGIGVGTSVITAILNDGTFIEINSVGGNYLFYHYKVNSESGNGFVVYFDINGEKGPNTFGKDLFVAVLTDNGFVPAYKDAAESVESDCSVTGTGYSCLMKYLGSFG